MGLFKKSSTRDTVNSTRVELVTEKGNGFYSWNGNLYQSDIVRACIRPKARAMGKLVLKHIRRWSQGEVKKLVHDPKGYTYIKLMLQEPNPLMTGQMFQEKLTTQLMLNNNAFALIVRDTFGLPMQMYPIPATTVEAVYNKDGELYLRFYLQNGKRHVFAYQDVIHLRRDFNENDIFGAPSGETLKNLMEVINTTDQSIIKAIRNSNIIRWLLKFSNKIRPEDLKKHTKEFVDAFLSSKSETAGAAASDTSFDAEQIKPTNFVPNAAQMDRATTRLYNFFNTNIDIIQSKFDEDKWNAYYEAEVEPDARQLAEEITRKIFSRKERGFGNQIIAESGMLQYASMSTKLGLEKMVIYGAMTPNEWRQIMNLAPLPGGDEAIRRKDTGLASEGVSTENGEEN